MTNEYEQLKDRWYAIAKRINDVNDANGWERPSKDNLPGKIMMVVTELWEAWEATQHYGYDPVHEEIADTSIRLLHILESLWPGEWVVRKSWVPRDPIHFTPIERVLWPVLDCACAAVEHWRHARDTDTRAALELALMHSISIATRLGRDPEKDITEKVDRNAKRGYLHGKKRDLG